MKHDILGHFFIYDDRVIVPDGIFLEEVENEIVRRFEYDVLAPQ